MTLFIIPIINTQRTGWSTYDTLWWRDSLWWLTTKCDFSSIYCFNLSFVYNMVCIFYCFFTFILLYIFVFHFVCFNFNFQNGCSKCIFHFVCFIWYFLNGYSFIPNKGNRIFPIDVAVIQKTRISKFQSIVFGKRIKMDNLLSSNCYEGM